MSDVNTLRQALHGTTDPVGCRLALADALAEDGQELAAAYQRCLAMPESDQWRLALAEVYERMPEEPRACRACEYNPGKVLVSPGPDGRWVKCMACLGTGELPDPTPRQRAELLRIQCERARSGIQPVPKWKIYARRDRRCLKCGAVWHFIEGDPNAPWTLATEKCGATCCDNVPMTYCVPLTEPEAAMLNRERDLLYALAPTLPPCPRQCSGGRIYSDDHDESHPCTCNAGRVGSYSRGLVEVVRVPRMSDIAQDRCDKCDGYDGAHAIADCSGDVKWQLTKWAISLFATHPAVLRIYCADRVPSRAEDAAESRALTGQTTFDFYAESVLSPGSVRRHADVVPDPVFDVMARRYPEQLMEGDRGIEFASADEANDAFAVAVADVAREATELLSG